MSNFTMLNQSKQSSSICPTFVAISPSENILKLTYDAYSNGRQTVGDGAFSSDMIPSVLAVCHVQGADSMYYYSTTFSGGPGVSAQSASSLRFASLTSDSGAFDTPTAKCPPDRGGSSDWVTDSLASSFPSTPSDTSDIPYNRTNTLSSFGSESFKDSNSPSPTSSVASFPFPTPPRDILAKRDVPSPDASTPPLTPDDMDDDGNSVAAISSKQGNNALEFLSALFPRNALGALPYAKSVEISSPNLGTAFEGVVLDLPGKTKTLYVDGKNAAHVNLRER